jgi:rod shape determining protein RodA
MRRFLNVFRGMDGWMIAAVGLLMLFGMVAIWSVGISRGTSELSKQFVAIALGAVVFVIVAGAHPRTVYRLRYLCAAGGFLALACVLVFGHVINGTRGWFRFGTLTVQPVEFAKLALLIVLAAILPLHARIRSLRAVIGASVVTAVFVVLTLSQPDLGSAAILVALWGAMLLVSGVPRRYVLLIFIVAVAVGGVAWRYGFHDYQRERVLTFIDPSRDPRGRGYNVTQAQIAVGSGGLLGRGFGSGSQSQLRFLPESQTDFIFAVIAEEFGLWAVFAVIGAFIFILLRLLRLARNAPDDFTQFIAIGAATLIATESFVAIGGNVGIIPVTGITLPFVSAGGSSMIAHLMLLGLVEGVHRAAMRGASLRRGAWQEV